jgi:small subunit ribosomal protein S9
MPVKKISKPAIAKKSVAHPKAKVAPKAVSTVKTTGYLAATGRRKTAIARVRFYPQGQKEMTVNDMPLEKYFPADLRQIIINALEKMGTFDKFNLIAKVSGGGLHAQAEAVRHGLARALVMFDPELRQQMKKTGFLTRDSRMRERKKFGLKRARRAPQWNKR